MEKKISWKNAVEYGGILVGAFFDCKVSCYCLCVVFDFVGDSELVTSAISEE